MSAIQPPEGLSLEDFEAIEAAVTETARGRWFLAEFARRTRAQETDKILTAIARLEHVMGVGPQQSPSPRDSRLAEALSAVCERLRDMAWMLRERGIESDLCVALEHEADVLARLHAPADALLERLSALAPLTAGPSRTRSQSLTERLDRLRPMPAPEMEPQTRAKVAPPPETGGMHAAMLADIDALPIREKLLFFA